MTQEEYLLKRALVLALVTMAVLLSVGSPTRVHGGTEDAEVSRTKNLQYFEMSPSVHPPGNASVTRTRNLQCCEMIPSVHPPGHALATRTRNLQYFEMAHYIHPRGDALVTRTRNLQYFEMESLLYQFKINITSLVVRNQSGNPTSNLTRGELAEFYFTIQSSEGSESLPLLQGLVATIVQDPLSNILFLGFAFEDLPRGTDKECTMGCRIPFETPQGTYKIKVMVFTDWPSEGGLSLASTESNFNVL